LIHFLSFVTTQAPLAGSVPAKAGAPMALGFLFAEEADQNGSDGVDGKFSNTEENKGIVAREMAVLLVLTMIDAVAAAKKVPPLIASKKVHFDDRSYCYRSNVIVMLIWTYLQTVNNINKWNQVQEELTHHADAAPLLVIFSPCLPFLATPSLVLILICSINQL